MASAGQPVPLNRPRPARVQAGADGFPRAVMWSGRRLTVAKAADVWRVADEWWRERPVARTYFTVVLEDGRAVTVFQDHVGRRWYEQRYG